MKTYHEAPLAVFEDVQKLTDGDYALVHLFETSSEYFETFKKAVSDGRDVILDNSLFELRDQFDPERYVYWINKLNPTWYVVPDAWKDPHRTVELYEEWMCEYEPQITSTAKRIVVAQGNDPDDVSWCYDYFDTVEPDSTMIAFSLDFSSYFYDRFETSGRVDKAVAMSLGRQMIISALENKGYINKEREHHLLGCGLPQEAQWATQFPFIRSIDTCNPCIFGYCYVRYSQFPSGKPFYKPLKRMCDIVNNDVGPMQKQIMLDNIKTMRGWINGEL